MAHKWLKMINKMEPQEIGQMANNNKNAAAQKWPRRPKRKEMHLPAKGQNSTKK